MKYDLIGSDGALMFNLIEPKPMVTPHFFLFFIWLKHIYRKDFMSPKYENRRKEFFATFSEFLRNYIRDKYYEFMNDIQTEVNFFE
jgi:hypothetical protein